MKIRISADSTCDLSTELIEKHGIEILPLHIIVEGQALKDGVQIGPDDIFRHVDLGGTIPKTAAVNVDEYRCAFERMLADCDAVIHINISSHFSSCYSNACLAAEGLNVRCIDSSNLSTGIGHVVMAACEMAERGMELDIIATELVNRLGKIESSFVIDRLDYLHKGGRCSAIAALGANLLKLRPCIEVKDGAMHVGKKYRGAYERCVKQYVAERLQGRTDLDLKRVFITHTGCSSQLVDDVRAAIAQYAEFAEVIETRAGCTISCHCGPNTLGILFFTK